MTAQPRNNSFVANMLRQTIDDAKTLIRSEIQLATTEVKENAMTMGRGGGMVAAGGVLGLYAFGLVLLGIVELLKDAIPEWLAYFLVGAVVGAIGACVAMFGRQRIKDAHLVPQQTVHSVNEDIEMIESRVR